MPLSRAGREREPAGRGTGPAPQGRRGGAPGPGRGRRPRRRPSRGRWLTGTDSTRPPRRIVRAGRKRCMWSKWGRPRKPARAKTLRPQPASGVRSFSRAPRTPLAIREDRRLSQPSRRRVRWPVTSSRPQPAPPTIPVPGLARFRFRRAFPSAIVVDTTREERTRERRVAPALDGVVPRRGRRAADPWNRSVPGDTITGGRVCSEVRDAGAERRGPASVDGMAHRLPGAGSLGGRRATAGTRWQAE